MSSEVIHCQQKATFTFFSDNNELETHDQLRLECDNWTGLFVCGLCLNLTHF